MADFAAIKLSIGKYVKVLKVSPNGTNANLARACEYMYLEPVRVERCGKYVTYVVSDSLDHQGCPNDCIVLLNNHPENP